jgi:redox-sensitive bicupin YhaK (pirin superfamily)
MATQVDTAQREVVLTEQAHIRPMMGLDVLEPLPSARIPYPMVDPYVLPQDVPVRHERDAIVQVLVGEGSPVELGTPGLILDVELPTGGGVASPVPPDFNGFVYMLEGQASFGANRRRASRSQIAVLGTGASLAVEEAQPGTRFMLMSGKPYGEAPIYNGPYVD